MWHPYPSPSTIAAWAQSDAEAKEILEKDGLSKVMLWTHDVVGACTVRPLASCRMGDDPHTSALDDRNSLSALFQPIVAFWRRLIWRVE